MRHILLAAASAALLAYAPAAWAQQVDTSADAYRHMNAEPVTSYGANTVTTTAPGGRNGGDGGWFSGLSIITPNDPEYSYSAPPHRGQPATWELNGDDRGRGTSYPAVYSIDGGSAGRGS